jgi:amino acid transporter
LAVVLVFWLRHSWASRLRPRTGSDARRWLARAGPAALLAYLAAALAVGLVALCFAECGSRVAASGGTYAYVETAVGPLPGALAGVFGYVSYFVASAAVANVFAGSLGALWAPLAAPGARVALILLLYAGLAWLNVRGVAGGARLVELTTVAKLAPLTLLALVGVFHVQPANFAGLHWPGATALAAATLVLVLAFTGTEAKDKLTPPGFDLAGPTTPAAFGKTISDDLVRWVPIVKASGATAD